jgi:type II secretory pathway pseudopilin PulG
MNNKKNKKGAGFTLIEVLVYIFIFIILITTITLFAFSFTETTTKTRIKREVSLSAYSIMKIILYEIKRADSIYTATSIFDTHPGQLSLETKQETPLGEKITYIDFYLDSDNKLYMRRESQTPQLLISEDFKVTNLEFKYLAFSLESIRINLTLEYDTAVSKYQYSYDLTSSGSIRK